MSGKKPSYPWPLEQMKQWYEKDLMTLHEIADRLASDDWQPYWKEHLGQEYRPNQKIVNKVAKKRGFSMRKTGAPGSRNGFWNGGRTIDDDGYLLVKCPNHPHATRSGYVRKHRLVAEQFLGRYLTATEVVHHEDEDPGNNDPTNLMVYETNAIHIAKTTTGKHRTTGPMIAEIARLREEWWEKRIDTIYQWHSQDKLTCRQIGELLDMHPRTISGQLRRRGFVVVTRHESTQPTEHHRLEAATLVATPHPHNKHDAAELQRRRDRLKEIRAKDGLPLSQTEGYLAIIRSQLSDSDSTHETVRESNQSVDTGAPPDQK